MSPAGGPVLAFDVGGTDLSDPDVGPFIVRQSGLLGAAQLLSTGARTR